MENEILKQILSELQELRQGQAKLEAGQAKLEADFAGLSAEQTSLAASQTSLAASQANLVSEVREIKGEVREIKERVMLIENEHSQSLDALHDGYSLLFDISQEIREDVRRLFKHQDKQDARFMLLSDEKHISNNDAV